MTIFLFGRKLKDENELHYVRQVFEFMTNQKIEVGVYKSFLKELHILGLKPEGIKIIATKKELLALSPKVAMTMGGDGTILQAAAFIQDCKIPVLGINLGRLGFLASVDKNHILKALKQVVGNKFSIEERSLLKLECNKNLFADFPFALNDFTLHKRDNSSMITIHVFVDGVLLNAYWADGIIISTPTGSTGYSLSCGGPIVFPDSSNFIITAVAPHNLNVRPIVLSDTHKIAVRVEGRSDNFMCTLDGRYETVTSEYLIEISKAEFNFGMVRLDGQQFMKTMSEKLWWGMDKRN